MVRLRKISNLAVLALLTAVPANAQQSLQYEQKEAIQAAGQAAAKGDAAGLARLKSMVDLGRGEAAVVLGQLYYSGQGVPKDEAQGWAWLSRAAAKSSPDGLMLAGLMRWSGQGVAKDEADSVRLLERAGDAGSARGWAEAGLRYFQGVNGVKDEARARGLFERAYQKNEAIGSACLGYLRLAGLGGPKDPVGATLAYGQLSRISGLGNAACVQNGAAQGNPWATFIFGRAKITGQAGIKADPAQGEQLLRTAADANVIGARRYLAILYEKGGQIPANPAEALRLNLQLANDGDKEAMYRAGMAYLKGVGTAVDGAKAKYWLRKAADFQHDYARMELAQAYAGARGLPREAAKAAEAMGRAACSYKDAYGWLQTEASRGDPYAQSALGQKFRNGACITSKGSHIVTNPDEGLRLMRLAAQSGRPETKLALAYALSADADKIQGSLFLPENDPSMVRKRALNAESARLIREAAEAGNPEAMSSHGSKMMSAAYWEKDPAAKARTLAEARNWLVRAMNGGSDNARSNLAYHLQSFGPAEKKESIDWYRKAAEAGDDRAAEELGKIYMRGDITAKNYAEAMRWYQRAQNIRPNYFYTEAMAEMLAAGGYGIQRDRPRALMFSELSSSDDERGFTREEAKNETAALAKTLTKAEMDRATQLLGLCRLQEQRRCETIQ